MFKGCVFFTSKPRNHKVLVGIITAVFPLVVARPTKPYTVFRVKSRPRVFSKPIVGIVG